MVVADTLVQTSPESGSPTYEVRGVVVSSTNLTFASASNININLITF